MSIEEFAARSETLQDHLTRVFERDREHIIEVLDKHAGRALAYLSPDTGFYLDFVTDAAARGSHSGMIGHDRVIPLCLERDIPVLDTRSMTTDDRIALLFSGPMLGVGRYDFENPIFTTGPLSCVRTAAFCAMWVAKGAVLHGEPYDLIDPKRRPFTGRASEAAA